MHYTISYANNYVMKQYVVDELRPGDADKLKDHFKKAFGPAELNSVFWIPVPEELLSEIQAAHKECQPLYFAVDIEEDRMACELLVRTRSAIRCGCISYATSAQREWFIGYIDSIFEENNIKT